MRKQQPFSFEATIIAITIVFLVLGAFIIIILLAFRKKRNTHLITFKQEMLKTRLEVQEQTLSNISREIHDNIGQVLSFVKLNLGLTNVPSEQLQHKMAESRELVAQAINDLRDLSKSLSFDQIAHLGLLKAIEIAADRVNKSGLVTTMLTVKGVPYPMEEQTELVLFRIFQESLNNALKHAEAQHFKIDLHFHQEWFNLTLTDDGHGFLINQNIKNGGGSGLKNIESRAALIGASSSIDSSPGQGTSVSVKINHVLSHINASRPYPDCIS